VSGSESLSWGYYGSQGAATATNLTGDLGFISNSRQDPFSIVFSGGRSWSTSDEPAYSFANLALSQVLAFGRWHFVASDSVSYLPGTPSTGLSGVPGAGDVGVNPVQVGVDTGQGVLTNYSTRISNTAAVSLQRQLTAKTSLNASGAYNILTFVNTPAGSNNEGLNSSSENGGGGLTHQFDARNSMAGNYIYSSFNYGVGVPGFVSQTASATYTHQFTRKFSMNVSAGPQWTSVNSSGGGTALSVFANAAAIYSGQFSRISLSYVHSTNAGSGVASGALSDSVSLTANRIYARVWNCAVTTSYARNANLPTSGVAAYSFDTEIASLQVSRAIVRSLSAYASYTLENQSSQASTATVDVFSGRSQVFSIGLTYSPSSIHFGRQ
jgi:hypothetical protein